MLLKSILQYDIQFDVQWWFNSFFLFSLRRVWVWGKNKRPGKEKNKNLLKITFMIVPEGDVYSLELNFQLS